jgi:hypothetical protein
MSGREEQAERRRSMELSKNRFDVTKWAGRFGSLDLSPVTRRDGSQG